MVARIDIAVGIGVGFGGDALLVVLGNGRRGIRFRLGKELRVLLRNLDGCSLLVYELKEGKGVDVRFISPPVLIQNFWRN